MILLLDRRGANTARPISAAFAAAPVSQFAVYAATPQRDSAVIGFSTTAAATDRASLFVSYDAQARPRYARQRY